MVLVAQLTIRCRAIVEDRYGFLPRGILAKVPPSQSSIAEKIAADHFAGLLSRREAMRRLATVGIGAHAAAQLISASGEERPPAAASLTNPHPGVDAAAPTEPAEFVGIATTVKTAGHTAVPGEIVCCDATCGGFTVMLPEAPDDGARIVVKKIDPTSNAVLVQRRGFDVFNQPDGPSSIQLGVPSQTVVLRYHSGVWYAESNSCPAASLDARYTPLHMRELMDAYGGTALAVTPTAGAVNYLQLDPGVTHGPKLSAAGAGTDLSLFLGAKNQGAVCILTDSGGTATIATYSDSGFAQPNQNLNLRTHGDGVVQANSVEVVTTSGNQTIRNKQIVPRVMSERTASSLTPGHPASDIYELTHLEQELTINASTDTTIAGRELLFRIRDNNKPQTLNWSKSYRPIGITMPKATVAGKWVYVRCIYNDTDTKWDVVDVRQEA